MANQTKVAFVRGLVVGFGAVFDGFTVVAAVIAAPMLNTLEAAAGAGHVTKDCNSAGSYTPGVSAPSTQEAQYRKTFSAII